MATTYMSLDLPVVSTTPGPLWATKINAAIETIDEHDHTSGYGRRITPFALNINSDLDFNDNDLYDAGRLGLSVLTSLITDSVSLYSLNGDLYFNDNSGNNIRITSAGAVNVSSTGGIGGDYGTGSSLVSFSAADDEYTFTDDGGSEAGIDIGALDTSSRQYHAVATISSDTTIADTDSYYDILVDSSTDSTITITLPLANLGYRHFRIKDTGGVDDLAITITPSGTDTIEGGTSTVLTAPYGAWELVSDGASAWWIL